MDSAIHIKSFERIVPMIYAYQTPGVSYHDGWTKIGYTEKKSVEDRINEQTHTAGIHWKLCWKNIAMYTDSSGDYFTDRDFHQYLTNYKHVQRDDSTEWFHIDSGTARDYFDDFASKEYLKQNSEPGSSYTLRKEQAEAVSVTKAYFEKGGKEFLWNAKPRFGKTLSAYDLVCQMGLLNVLIVTNRPSIANSWADDFFRFIAWQKPLCFVSETDALKGRKGVLSRKEYENILQKCSRENTGNKGMIAFVSLQDLKGSMYFGGGLDKLKWIKDLNFDLLIVDEAQEGVDTIRTERAFSLIKKKHILYLSGTPFKALANEQFAADQIYNWSYADEQKAKADWDESLGTNPYERLPKMEMYTYQLSNMIRDVISSGADIPESGEKVDYAFDLNEFFSTNESGRFKYEDDVKKFLHSLTTQEKYPFSTPELREELSHTLWLLDRVASAKALARLLKETPEFSGYEIVIAAGDGRLSEDDENQKSFDKVKDAIKNHDKTITLSVGQLTVGVTIPEWSAVLMLCNLKSPSAYMQAAFRAQNPCKIKGNCAGKPQYYRKERCYVFDFDPARTLIIFDEFANNLLPAAAAGSREKNIRELLNFFPVLGEDSEGRMVELDAAQVLSIPRKLKCQQVVRSGFISNFLFKDISNVFGAPKLVQDILENILPASQNKSTSQKKVSLDEISEVPVDDNGDVQVPDEVVIGRTQDLFGPKIYTELSSGVTPVVEKISTLKPEQTDVISQQIEQVKSAVKETVHEKVLKPVFDTYTPRKRVQNQITAQTDNQIEKTLDDSLQNYQTTVKIAQSEYQKAVENAQNSAQHQEACKKLEKTLRTAQDKVTQEVSDKLKVIISKAPEAATKAAEINKAEIKKNEQMEKIRDHLRGFSRSIPSFIMAYGDKNLTLQNFDDYTEDDVFLEVTGISEDDFRFLRDGGDRQNPETGAVEHFKGNLFDETVFNDSIQEFLRKKDELANYFDETHSEDIFDYIPPQKTNQIFTPRKVVRQMADELEENNPGCFDNPDVTFADLYMKSGLYITEIVKRLYRSEKMKKKFPDSRERIVHILQKQVYGMAPSRIIYLIATNYIFGFDESLRTATTNFVEADAAKAAKNGTLQELVNEKFGKN